jgi:hypothetical protein
VIIALPEQLAFQQQREVLVENNKYAVQRSKNTKFRGSTIRYMHLA